MKIRNWPYHESRSIKYRSFERNVQKFYFLKFILYYDQQMHNYLKLSHSYTFLHYRVILRELVINVLPSYTNISNVPIGNTVYN